MWLMVSETLCPLFRKHIFFPDTSITLGFLFFVLILKSSSRFMEN